MSASFKLAKKKVSQHDLRRLMQEQKLSRTNSTINEKIDSPFAKYDGGQLTCQLCKSVVRSAPVWKVHINTKLHKENLALAKELKEKLVKAEEKGAPAMEDRLAALKKLRSETEPAEKKLKLANNASSALPSSSSERKESPNGAVVNGSSASIPDDFFDSKRKPANADKTAAQSSPSKQEENKPTADETLPEGFFDDPKKDAKARNVECKDQAAEEWERFLKEIKEAEALSLNIINEEQEEATTERQIDEIDAQIKNWSRVLELEKKKELIESKLKGRKAQTARIPMEVEASDGEDDEEIPEFLDWRAKKSHE